MPIKQPRNNNNIHRKCNIHDFPENNKLVAVSSTFAQGGERKPRLLHCSTGTQPPKKSTVTFTETVISKGFPEDNKKMLTVRSIYVQRGGRKPRTDPTMLTGQEKGLFPESGFHACELKKAQSKLSKYENNAQDISDVKKEAA